MENNSSLFINKGNKSYLNSNPYSIHHLNMNNEIENIFNIFDEFPPSNEEEQNPPSPYIERNYNKNERSITKEADVIVEITNNFSNAETNDTNKFINKKKKIINNSNNNAIVKKNNKNKYSTENLRRKIKTISLDFIMKFYNKRIAEIFKNDLAHGINKRILFKNNQAQIQNMNLDYNNKLLNKKMKEIFSDDISKKYTDYPPSHNKDLINRLLNEEDEEKKNQLVNLFNKTFKECIKHLRGDKILKGLEGLEQYYIDYMNKEIIPLDENEDAIKYKNQFQETFKNFENCFNNKRAGKKN